MYLLMSFSQAADQAINNPGYTLAFVCDNKRKTVRQFVNFLKDNNVHQFTVQYNKWRVDIGTSTILFYDKVEDLIRMRGIQFSGCTIDESNEENK